MQEQDKQTPVVDADTVNTDATKTVETATINEDVAPVADVIV